MIKIILKSLTIFALFLMLSAQQGCQTTSAMGEKKLTPKEEVKQKMILEIKTEIENLEIKNIKNDKSKIIDIPVCFDEEFSLDIERLKTKLDLTKDEILEKYLSKNYFCYMTGFVAGMPFLGDLEQKLQLKRLETPRVKVPKGSVGLTEQFCNIYTFESPGGWNIIGKTSVNIFDNTKKTPNLINPGDTVSFYQISKSDYEKNYE